ncbi:MAG TPA: hypoxanthine phosphoribosyltransferase [Anaerolineales bacterium]|nr:hypoxanthine phosphoribosyltransferase [Anaerolineales bacterium]
MQDYHEFLSEVLIDEDTLQKRISELAAEINRDYAGQDLILLCILRGGMVFLVDLMRQLDVPHEVDIMAISSYGRNVRESHGNVRLTLDLQLDIRDRNVLLVEDIIDSGNTIAYVLEFLSTRMPRSLRVCSLLDKEERREVVVPIHYRGFTIPDKFVFGYGLDIDEYFRNLPFIGVVDLDKYKQPGSNG